MKRLIGIVLGITAVLAMTVPAAAQTNVPVTATVGGGGSAPYMIALWQTPDEITTDTDGIVDIYPESAIPNASVPLFPPADLNADGWKRVKFYLMADHEQLGHDAITGMTIDVYYPNEAKTRKFEINALKTGANWTASQSGYAPESYPAAPGDTAVAAVPPAPPSGWNVRELSYTDLVDVNASSNSNPFVADIPDMAVGPFLTAWGNRVVYGTNPVGGAPWNAVTAGARLQSDQALCLELTGWIWFHQDPLEYIVEGKASKGMQSPALTNWFEFIGVTNLYLDFSQVAYGTFNSDIGEIVKQGDTDLGTNGAPTIWNNGNVNAQVNISATKMVLNGNQADYNNPAKTISVFDAVLHYKNGAGTDVQVGKVIFNNDTTTVIANDLGQVPPELGTTGNVLLQACRPAKISFSLHPVSGIDNGSYTGSLTLSLSPFSGDQQVQP